jgi:beta-glucanase (GH16 family)
VNSSSFSRHQQQRKTIASTASSFHPMANRFLVKQQQQWSRSKRWFRSIKLLFALSLLLLCNTGQLRGGIRVVRADWIDPATPQEARFTKPYNVRAPPKPKDDDDDETQSKTKTKTTTARKKNVTRITEMPTPAPTSSTDAPSNRPSASPTMYPTFHPDRVFELVFSDEFQVDGRQFYDGADPRWTAMDKNDYTNDALHYYSSKNVRTELGQLIITSEAADTDVVGFDDVKRERTHVTKHFRSAMLQTWNKFCLTGGIIEAQVTLPGKYNVGGLWPAFWLLGNLARHTYVGSSEHIWPWSSSLCYPKELRAQRISGCDAVDHYGFQSFLGRGAPEIDIFEVQPGNIPHNQGQFLKSPVGQPFMSASFQVAPGRTNNRPGPGEWPGPGQWYEGLLGGRDTAPNIYFYGTYNHFLSDVDPAKQDYWSDAISYNRQLNESFFEIPHIYRLEWDVPGNHSDGYLHWFVDGEMVLSINGTSLRKAGYGAEISSEPSYIIVNTAVSKQWGFPKECPANCPCKVYDCNSRQWQNFCGFSPGFCKMMLEKPPEYKIDWIRAYQDPHDPKHKVGCSTPERPTRKFIVANEKLYKTEADAHPLKGVPQGLGRCDPKVDASSSSGPEACGGKHRGRCTNGHVCECQPGWTGPHCLANVAYDDIQYDVPDTIRDVGFILPQVAPVALYGGLGILLFSLLLSTQCRRRLAHWEPVPDAEVKRTYLYAPSEAQPQLVVFSYHRRRESV